MEDNRKSAKKDKQVLKNNYNENNMTKSVRFESENLFQKKKLK